MGGTMKMPPTDKEMRSTCQNVESLLVVASDPY